MHRFEDETYITLYYYPSNVVVEVTSFTYIFYGNEVDGYSSLSAIGCACTFSNAVPLANGLATRMMHNHQQLPNYYYVDLLT